MLACSKQRSQWARASCLGMHACFKWYVFCSRQVWAIVAVWRQTMERRVTFSSHPCRLCVHTYIEDFSPYRRWLLLFACTAGTHVHSQTNTRTYRTSPPKFRFLYSLLHAQFPVELLHSNALVASMGEHVLKGLEQTPLQVYQVYGICRSKGAHVHNESLLTCA